MPDNKTKETRIALIMGGGVSLGSFSGGALLKCLELFEHVARGPARIDVVTGASAGSMTLGVVAYHLFRGSTLQEVRDALADAWVREISFDRLRPENLGRHDHPSLFSDRVIREIANRLLRLDAPLAPDPHPFFADGLRVSFALTNLNGVPVRADGQIIRQAKTGGAPEAGSSSAFADAVQTTFHQDAMRFVLRRSGAAAPSEPGRPEFEGDARVLRPWREPGPSGAGSVDRQAAESWRIFREAAIASGAFPVAFPPVPLHRYEPEIAAWPDDLPGKDFVFDYVDGGVLRNEPFREAIHLAGLQDRHGEGFERVFILIDPNVSGTTEAFALPYNHAPQLKGQYGDDGSVTHWDLAMPAYGARLGGVMGRFAGMLASQAAYRDWVKAARVNSQIEWRDRLLENLIPHLQVAPGSNAETELNKMLEEIYIERARRAPGSELADVEGELTEAQRRRALAPMAADLERRQGEAGSDFAARLLLLVDLIGNLRQKRRLNMVAITPHDLPLAGSYLAGFGGFFDQKHREYDFEAGSFAAARVLSTSVGRDFLGPTRPPIPERPKPLEPHPSYARLDRSIQAEVESLVGGHISGIASAMGLPSVVVQGLWLFGKKRVRRVLRATRSGKEAAFVLRIEEAHGLSLRGNRGSELKADRDGVIETAVGVFVDRAGAESEIYGPHVFNGDQPPRVQVWESNGILKRPRHVGTMSFVGSEADWQASASTRATAVLKARFVREKNVALHPEEIHDEGPLRKHVRAETG